MITRIRSVRDDDFDTIAAITNYYIANTTIHFAYSPVTPDEMRAHRVERYPFLVYEEDGNVLGYAKAGVWRTREAYNWTAELGVYVSSSTRGRGVGRAVYEALLLECERSGFRSVVAGITMPNDASVKLHEALGFDYVGTFRDAGWKQGAWNDVAWYQKRFAIDPSGPR
jgi:L-amino acid N-acyltransferase YncA